MDEPNWVNRAVVLALQEEQLLEHGGASGIRDEGLLDSALERPRNQFVYGTPDILDLAAAYAFGITKNHPFLDGNKRVSLVVAELFLELNGFELIATDTETYIEWLSLADGRLTELQLAEWLRANSKKQ